MSPPSEPLIARNDEGIPVIVGANTKVVQLVSFVRARDKAPEEVQEQLPHLSVEQIEAALAFYEDHRQEIDEDIERRIAEAERIREELGQPPIVERIRRMRAESKDRR